MQGSKIPWVLRLNTEYPAVSRNQALAIADRNAMHKKQNAMYKNTRLTFIRRCRKPLRTLKIAQDFYLIGHTP